MNRPEMKSLYKILHTTCHKKWENTGERIFNESVWMEKNGHKIIIAAPVNSPLFLKAKKHGFKVYGVEFKFFSKIKDYKLLKTILYNEKPDVINTHGSRDSRLALFAARKARVPLRILSRHIPDHIRNFWYNRIVYKRFCHYIFTTSDTMTKYLQKVFKLKDMQIFSMPDGIGVPNLLPEKPAAGKALAQKLGLDPETKFIGCTGKISKENSKGLSTLLEAFKKAEPGLSGYHLVIAGDGTGEQLALLENLAKTLQIDNKVHFVELKKDLWSYYRALDCYILPPAIDMDRVQKIPRSLLQAMLCECPVICYKDDELAGIIDPDKTGLLFEPSEPSDLSEKILEALQDKAATQKRVDTARDLVQKKHTIDTMGRNIIRIYRLHQVKLDRRSY